MLTLRLPAFCCTKYVASPLIRGLGEAGQVTGRRLHLDDVGAEVGEHPRAVRPGEHTREVEDTNAVQGPATDRRYVSSRGLRPDYPD